MKINEYKLKKEDIHKLGESLEKGTWFDGSSIEGFTRIAESDMYLKPDISTYALLPWETGEESTARIICDVFFYLQN